MKMYVLAMVGVVALGLTAMAVLAADQPAAPAPGKDEGIRHQAGQMADRLGLTPDQREAARAIIKAAHEEAQKAPDREAKANILREAFEKVKTTVLNDEQRQELAQVREGLGERIREIMGRVAERLGLTPEQKEAAKAIMQAAREEAQKAPEREAKAKILRGAFEKVKTTVLTDEQRQKLEKMREAFKERRQGCEGVKTPEK